MSDLGFNVRPKYRGHTETGPRFEVSSERPEERRIEPATPELNSSAQNTIQMLPKSVERSEEDYQCHPILFHSTPLHLSIKLCLSGASACAQGSK